MANTPYLTFVDLPSETTPLDSTNLNGIQVDIKDDIDSVRTQIATDLQNYYTKTQVDNLISVIPRWTVVVVQTLPTQDISTTTIYLVPSSNPKTQNAYDEFIYTNNAWEQIGSTAIDLDTLYTKTEVDDLLDDKQDTLVSGTNIKTINNNSLVGSGDVHIDAEPEISISYTTPSGDEKLWINSRYPQYDYDEVKYYYNNEWLPLRISALDGMPVGTIVAYAGTVIPTGWLECDGSTVADELYPELHYVLGGSGLTFTLPDLRGRTIVGHNTSDTDFSVLRSTGGSKNLKANWNAFIAGNGRLYFDFEEAYGSNYTENKRYFTTDQGNSTSPHSETSNAGLRVQGNTDSRNSMPPYGVYKWIIKAKNTTPIMADVVDEYSTSTNDAYSCNYVNEQLEQKGETVWVNTVSSNSFPNTQTNVIWGDYKSFKVFYYLDYNLEYMRSKTVDINSILNISENNNTLTRIIEISSSRLYIHSGYYQGSQNNGAIIPSHIIGYK